MSSGRKVLIVDSNVLDVLNAEEKLGGAGYGVARLTSPNGVLAKVEYDRPDVLLLDITMPRLNVPELLAGLRADATLQDLVVVLFSDLDAATLQEMCVNNDIHGYFCKSMGMEKLPSFLDQFYEE